MAKSHQIELSIAGIKLLGGGKKRSSAQTTVDLGFVRRAAKKLGKDQKKSVRFVRSNTKSAKKTIKRAVKDLKRSPLGRAAATLLTEKKRNKVIYKAKKTAAKLYRGFVKTYVQSKKQYQRASRARIKKMTKYWRRHGGRYIAKRGIVKLMKATKLKRLPRAKQIKRFVVKTVKKYS